MVKYYGRDEKEDLTKAHLKFKKNQKGEIVSQWPDHVL